MTTLQELTIRSEVEGCVAEMLVDVETLHYLQQDVRVKTAQDKAQHMELQQRTTVDETRIMLQEYKSKQTELADDFVKELHKFNREVESLVLWKHENERKVEEYNELERKLQQTQQELIMAQAQAKSVSSAAAKSAVIATAATVAATTSAAAVQQNENTTTSTAAATATKSGIEKIAKSPSALLDKEEGDVLKPAATDSEAAAVAEEDEEEPVTLESIDAAADLPTATTTTAAGETDDDDAAGSTQAPGEAAQEEQAKAVATTEAPPSQPVGGETTETVPPGSDEAEDSKPAAVVEGKAAADTEESKDEAAKETEPSSALATVEEGATAAVSLEKPEPETKPPSLADVDVEILMRIFGFMDAIDILNTAQISLSMYTRVDALFGIGEDGHTAPGTMPQIAEPAPAPAPAAAAKPSATATAKPATVKPPPPSSSAKSAPKPATASATVPKAAPTKPSPKPAPAEAPSSGLGLGLFSMLQPRGLSAAPAAAAAAAAKTAASTTTGNKGQQPLNPRLAQSMASKLSDAELAAIISMTDKLNKLERQLIITTSEKEECQAKLSGTEAVKQFLIGKVRDAEIKLQKNQENEVKVTQQISSDQEVIAFLDSRVQELEGTMVRTVTEKSSTEMELKVLKESSSKKITVLTDMLKYEREKLREQESDWKATKKVLVKEVKSCRAQIIALQAERDGYKEQNEMLKRAITSSGVGGGGGSGSGKGDGRSLRR